jgi:glycosyltransferase involved in cell wall biosynthesis
LKHEPLISIIINNYNYGRFLKDAIDSALRQTYRNIEVIVVDDGSTDNSREIICGYGDQIVTILEENGGQASAFNAGFARSRGDVIFFLDSDDVLLPDTVEQVIEVFRAQTDVAKVMYRMEVIDAMGQRTGVIKPPPHLPLRNGDLRRYVLTCPFDTTWMATSANAFAARVLRQIFPIPEQAYGRVGADWYVSHLTLLFGPVVSLDHIGAYYRVHDSNNYEPSTTTIDLPHIRQTILYSQRTLVYIKKFADQLNLEDRPSKVDDILSVSLLANKLISLKLEPLRHPTPEDRMWRLWFLGIVASLRRFDVSIYVKCLFLLWFTAMVIAPKAIVRWLAIKFLFPQTRGNFNLVLKVLHGIQQ